MDNLHSVSLREENARLRQRVEELERAGLRPEEIAQPFMARAEAADRRAEAAEAKLARATALLKTFYSDAYIEEILTAAKGEP